MAKNKGFTLIEIVIAITIISLIGGLSTFAYRNYNNKNTLDTETSKLVSSLEVAKNKALAGEEPCPQYAGTYSFSWTTTGYTITPDGCPTKLNYSLPDRMSLDETGTTTFKSLGLGAEAECIIIHSIQTDSCRKVIIDTSGRISDETPASCTCP